MEDLIIVSSSALWNVQLYISSQLEEMMWYGARQRGRMWGEWNLSNCRPACARKWCWQQSGRVSCGLGEPSRSGWMIPHREIAFPDRFYWKQIQQQVSALGGCEDFTVKWRGREGKGLLFHKGTYSDKMVIILLFFTKRRPPSLKICCFIPHTSPHCAFSLSCPHFSFCFLLSPIYCSWLVKLLYFTTVILFSALDYWHQEHFLGQF